MCFTEQLKELKLLDDLNFVDLRHSFVDDSAEAFECSCSELHVVWLCKLFEVRNEFPKELKRIPVYQLCDDPECLSDRFGLKVGVLLQNS